VNDISAAEVRLTYTRHERKRRSTETPRFATGLGNSPETGGVSSPWQPVDIHHVWSLDLNDKHRGWMDWALSLLGMV
jgi:hypothetical protein